VGHDRAPTCQVFSSWTTTTPQRVFTCLPQFLVPSALTGEHTQLGRNIQKRAPPSGIPCTNYQLHRLQFGETEILSLARPQYNAERLRQLNNNVKELLQEFPLRLRSSTQKLNHRSPKLDAFTAPAPGNSLPQEAT